MPRRIATILTVLLIAAPARAVIILGPGDDPAGGRNLNAPTVGPYLNAGWQYTGFFGGVTGFPIGPRDFVTAVHVGDGGGGTFSYANGTGTTSTYTASLAGTRDDLAVWQ